MSSACAALLVQFPPWVTVWGYGWRPAVGPGSQAPGAPCPAAAHAPSRPAAAHAPRPRLAPRT